MTTKITEEMIKANPVSIPDILAQNIIEAMGVESIEDLPSKQMLAFMNNKRKRNIWSERAIKESDKTEEVDRLIHANKSTLKLAENLSQDPDKWLTFTSLRSLLHFRSVFVSTGLQAIEKLPALLKEAEELAFPDIVAFQDLLHAIGDEIKEKENLIKEVADDRTKTAAEFFIEHQQYFDLALKGLPFIKRLEIAVRPFKTKAQRMSKVRNRYDKMNDKLGKVMYQQYLDMRNCAEFMSAIYGDAEESERLALANAFTQARDSIQNTLDMTKKHIAKDSDILGYKYIEDSKKEFTKCATYLERKYVLTYTKRNGRIVAYLNSRLSSYRYNRGQCPKRIKNDAGEYVFMLNPVYMDNFLALNNIHDDEVYVTSDSLDVFYGFQRENTIRFSKLLSKSFIDEWRNYDCPNLMRYTPNKRQYTNMLGMRLVMFSNTLAEITWQGNYYDEEMTIEEINTIIKQLDGDSRIKKDLQNIIIGRKSDDDDISKMEEFVAAYDAAVQKIFDENKDMAFMALRKEFPDRVSEKDGETYFNDNFGFDCGFIHFNTKNAEYKTKREVLRNSGKTKNRYSVDMDVRLPVFYQSTTAQRVIASALVEEVKKQLGYEITYYTVLD